MVIEIFENRVISSSANAVWRVSQRVVAEADSVNIERVIDLDLATSSQKGDRWVTR